MTIDGSQASTASLFARRLVEINWYVLHFLTAMYLSHAITVKWDSTEVDPQYITARPMRSKIQTLSRNVWWAINKSITAVNGRDTAPTQMSARAILHNRIVDALCKSLLLLTAAISNALRRKITGEARIVIPNISQAKVVSPKSQE